MPKQKTIYLCNDCGYESPTWLGKCPSCSAWNSFKEFNVTPQKNASSARSLLHLNTETSGPVSLKTVKESAYSRMQTSLTEFDRVLGGGIVPGSVILIAGEPGIGKSTILLQISMITAKDKNILYVAGEESPEQIKMRATRIGDIPENVIVYPESNIESILDTLQKYPKKPDLVILDSIQTAFSNNIDGQAGSVSQVKEVTSKLVHYAKSTHTPIILVGHITKDGTIAGPKVLEHLVDALIYIEGDRYNDLRIIRATKNRFGASGEMGVFQMTDTGLNEIKNPSGIFLEERNLSPGAVAVPIIEGVRPIILEVQALVSKSFLPVPRRTASGFDINRLQMLTAVITKRLGIQLFDQDIFVNVVGGVKIAEPAADLAVVAALISSIKNTPIPLNTIVFGEVGLQGEVRKVNKEDNRIKEAKNLGFDSYIYPKNTKNLQELVKNLK